MSAVDSAMARWIRWRSDAGGSIALETLPKGAVLAAVEGQHRRIKRDAGKRAVDHTTRDTLALGVARHGGEEAVEVAAAARRAGRRGAQENAAKKHDFLSCA